MKQIHTAAQVIAINQDIAMLSGNMLVRRTEDCDTGKWWVYYEDGSEAFVSEKEYLMELMKQ